jgi:glutamyl-tRNA reductase
MDRIAIAGWTLSSAAVADLERAKLAGAKAREGLARSLADALAASELVVLSTCNRFEVAYAREEGDHPRREDLQALAAALGLEADDTLLEHVRWYGGLEAARHLLRTSASLDSLVLGESQIQTQVREACDAAQAQGLVGSLLGGLFQQAQRCGREVRKRTEISARPVSVVSVAALALARHYRGLGPRIGVIGAGHMAHAFARSLPLHELTLSVVANRSLQRAQELARPLGASAMTLEHFLEQPPPLDAILSATSAPHALLTEAFLARAAERAPLGTGLMVLDVAVPRDVEPCADARVKVVDLEGLRAVADENRRTRQREGERAERIVEEQLAAWATRFAHQELKSTLEELRQESEHVLERELANLHGTKFAHLPARERELIERWAREALGRVAHVSIAAVKRMAGGREGLARLEAEPRERA